MDPDATLEALRSAVSAYENGQSPAITEFIEYFDALDDWLSRGGLLPGDWFFERKERAVPANPGRVVTPLDPVAAVRANPQWYFASGKFEPAVMLALLVSEAVFHGSTDVLIEGIEGWWVIASAHDWIGESAHDPFLSPAPDPERGQNSVRVEVVLTAFCPQVITSTAGVVRTHGMDAGSAKVVRGNLPGPALVMVDDPEWGRVIAFQPPVDN